MKGILKSVLFNVKLIVAVIMDFFTERFVEKAFAGRISKPQHILFD